ncbi:bis(5'-nucleosyl)-tetraphosphatase (symmetrical) ApaH [Aliivibrio fischeri]|uniref:bis(5'-nucleosyl)-tetraphosphatase (symmetrical) ApaH n=1 Tax=Aliivibrio fischeri TaxID=668 RepID=UPI001F36D628|nr:bis(5'-nucleosyl)-tetraphosphatase (symmetrical) ApaH [Aliivibrio fischeri]MCE4937031.1 bis(5'-nucleosyl)-tetraphosphatase (symmetrical) ApaH [Aliivibrio fischeri]
MATYFVGDIQGCLDELLLLLEHVEFNREKDQLWLTGDLVARGPKSLETLRFVKSLGNAAITILGNHDLHLLAVSQGISRVKEKDKTAPIFTAPDSEDLLTWLRHQPLLAVHSEYDIVMTHAGIPPQWDMPTAIECAREVESILLSDKWVWLLENMYENHPDTWDVTLSGIERYRYIINAFTRMRFCHLDGRLDMECKLPPQDINSDELVPWFELENRLPLSHKVIFGHWAALMGHEGNNVIALDTGCVWGEYMTMYRIDDGKYFTQKAIEQ